MQGWNHQMQAKEQLAKTHCQLSTSRLSLFGRRRWVCPMSSACGVIGLWAKSSQRLLVALSLQRPEAPSSAAKGERERERELEDPATGKASALAFASKASAEASAC